MDGLTKLKLVLIVLLILMVTAIITAFIIATIEENKTLGVYKSLSESEQDTISSFFDNLPDYKLIYIIIGFMQYAVAIGLFILLTKLWSMKKI